MKRKLKKGRRLKNHLLPSPITGNLHEFKIENNKNSGPW